MGLLRGALASVPSCRQWARREAAGPPQYFGALQEWRDRLPGAASPAIAQPAHVPDPYPPSGLCSADAPPWSAALHR
jgi:hypothetical protein